MADIEYGVDFSCTTDLDPLLILVSGDELMGQVCVRRLFARPGSDISNPVDNTLDARDFVAAGITPSDLPSIGGRCASALNGDQRISGATVAATFNPNTHLMSLAISAFGANGPFNLTLSVSAVTIEILRP